MQQPQFRLGYLSAQFAVLATAAFCGPTAALLLAQLHVLKPLSVVIALACQTLGFVMARARRDGGGDELQRATLLVSALSASFFYAVIIALELFDNCNINRSHIQ